MRVLLLGDITGTRDGVDWPPRGSIVDLPDEEAIALCRPGVNMARPVTDAELGEERAVDDDADVEPRSGMTTKTVQGRRAPRTA